MLKGIRLFQADRLVKIAGGDTPIPLGQVGKVVLHVIPLPSFVDGRFADIASELAKGTHVPVPLDERGRLPCQAVNLDGYLNYSDDAPGTRQAYAQFFRNGAIEGVGELRSDDKVNSRFLSEDLTSQWCRSRPISREIVAMPEIFIDSFDVDVIDLMQTAFNVLWNAVGFEGCDRYNDVAKWKASNPYALRWR